MSAWVIYRGPLERSRLSYLLETAARQYGAVNFIWIFPGVMTEQRLTAYQNYIKTQPVAAEYVINQPLKSYVSTRTKIKSIVKEKTDVLICIGFSSLWYSSTVKFNKLIWCVNGIPEEKELTSRLPKIFTTLSWSVCKVFAKPQLIVVVSSGMKKLVTEHMKNIPVFVAPTCVDISTFRKNNRAQRKYFTYLGTGAAWQALDLLSVLWQEIHTLDKSIVFRVISRDQRAKILAQNISSENIEFVSSNEFAEVAQWLTEAEVGFLVRRNTLVNRVSFPTKLAEYLAAGAWVVSSDFEWEVKEYITTYSCGILVNDVNKSAAEKILQFRKEIDPVKLSKDVNQCANALDRQRWVALLHERLNQLA
jgi:glycosyltransferase involved in cell wall biosynthesis